MEPYWIHGERQCWDSYVNGSTSPCSSVDCAAE